MCKLRFTHNLIRINPACRQTPHTLTAYARRDKMETPMSRSYRYINNKLARQIRLVMTDVDGTLTPGGDLLGAVVLETTRHLEEQGITVGLASGQTLNRLESLAEKLGISGPLIAENGGVARLKPKGELVALGYSRQPALATLQKLKRLFPDAIAEREDNKDRLVDVVFWSRGVEIEELRRHLEDVELLDSGYILHLIQKGVSKGRTLMRLLSQIGDGQMSPAEVLVFGDSATDLSLFQLFPNSVLIINPRLSVGQRRPLQKVARYVSDLPPGEGFAQAACHILNARLAPNAKN